MYEQFKHDEPWDSEHNLKLIEQMPDAFRNDGVKGNKTEFVAILGKGFVFDPERNGITYGEGIHSRLITDGANNTLLIATISPEYAVVWTKPDDLVVDLKNPSQKLSDRYDGGFIRLSADGHVQTFKKSISPAHLIAMLTIAGGEKIDLSASNPFNGPLPTAPPTPVEN